MVMGTFRVSSMRRLKLVAPVAAAALTAMVNTAIAAESPPPDRAHEAAAVQGVAAAFVDDWNRHDMKWWHGRAEIQAQHEALHATRMRLSHLVATETVVHVLRSDVAVVYMRWQLTGDTGIDGVTLPARRGVMSLVTVEEGGNWRIVSAQNTDMISAQNTPSAKESVHSKCVRSRLPD